ncbi:cytidylyltransferase domain-containing protein [Helicobacter kayseriensis]|uniref:acylneuraminate cytidylyltransferase family protein n=1 Tax=Helicobacter kayseriensis TaxID=2905877 RepID=UPI001E31FED2|nr:hypothetical protein [Helicobacter kayseriensis]MCE3046688.1 hypothetical protein [Helicobacter kayseriensis]MCE3048010.1 hypothetical protein [Helicobacter kayseriensis]
MQRVIAVIAARQGSQRLKNKNILPFDQSNLLIHKIRQLKKVREIERVVVSSDSSLMLDMAEKEGAEVQKRPLEYADERSRTFGEVVSWIVKDLNADHIVWAPCVAPLCDEYVFQQALKAYYEHVIFSKYYDSLVTVKVIRDYIWDRKKPLNYSLDRHVPSQQLPYWVSVVNGCFISSKQQILKNSFCYGEMPYFLEIDKFSAIDIDDEFDLEYARFVYERRRVEKISRERTDD